jgi:UDP-2-acetamido-2,6-beta-L-arabino-hexul-4-ose reductase
MKTIGITGQNGFIGSHLLNELSLLGGQFKLIPFEKSFFDQPDKLSSWAAACDVIVHLAGINRSPDEQYIYDANVALTASLIEALESRAHTPHVIFSSSTQEERPNTYGRAKKDARNLWVQWAERSNAVFTGLIVPNVFGPFGKPFYNSVIATFCHQLCEGQIPAIDVDGALKLIYVGDLCARIKELIQEGRNGHEFIVPHAYSCKVSQILHTLQRFKDQYFDNGIFPALGSTFELQLFNTFRSFIPLATYFPRHFTLHSDNRGDFVELVKLHQYGQVSFSTTRPGVTRGNHFHTRKIERFAVIKGRATIQLRKYNTDEVFSFELDGARPSYVDMPIWYTHNITNTGTEDLYTIFWINEFYNPEDPDTYFENV